MRKKILSLFLALATSVGMMWAQNPSGSCGANLSWEFNSSTGTLTITGTGAMNDWNDDTQLPWYSNRLNITSVSLPEGLTVLGVKAFRGCTNLVTINTGNVLPSTVTTIKQEAFCNTGLTNITIPASVVSIEQDAFYLSKTITDVYCYADPNNLTWVDYYCDDFAKDHITVCHVKSCHLDTYQTNWGGTTYNSSNSGVNLTFTGDLPGECGGSSDPQDPEQATDGGMLSGAFSVGASKVVYFSQGNLQYQASTNTWRFAEHQYDIIGDAAGNTTVSGRDAQSDWIDLFGWATSGNSASGTAYQPWTNSANHSEYGPAITSGDWTYANSDWGINPISNGGNTAGSWRTLSQTEWNYLLFEREGNRFAYARLNIGGNYIYGLIILPDDWNTSYYALGSINETNHSYESNQITAENWTNSLEAHGAVFLPITGSRNENQIYGIDGENSYGLYWSSTAGEYYEEIENEFEPEQPIVIDIKNAAYALQFAGGYYIRNNVTRRATGVAVRLVAETAPGSGSTPDPDPQDPQPSVGDYTISLDIAENADKVTLNAASANAGETITVTPAAGYQITSFTATSGSGNSAVRFTSDPNESVYDAEPQYVALPHEFTANVIPGNNGASFVEIEGGEGQIEYVGMNTAKDQLTFRVNGTFSGTALVRYSHDELECEELEPGADPMCIGVTAFSTIRVICAAEGGGSEVQSVKDDVIGAYSFTMPAGNVTITATVEAIPAPANPAVGMKGSWDDWTDQLDFTDNADGTASASLNITGGEGYYTFKVVLDNTDWRGNGEAFKRSYTSASGITENTDMTLWVDAKGTYTFTWTYATNAIEIGFPTLPVAHMKGSWDDWTDAVNFTNNGDGTASYTLSVTTPGYYNFQMNIGDNDWRGNGYTYTRAYTGASWINSTNEPSNMCINADVAGDYIITWTYVENKIEITFPAPASTAVEIGDPNNASEVETFLTTYDGQTIDELIIDRPVLNNMYNTLCLPFHMDADQIAASSLNGVEIYEFVDADVTNDELYLYTSEQKHEIVAGRPYLVKYSAASQLDDLDFVNVTINNADLDDQAVTIKGVTFKGTFQPIVLGAQTKLDFNGGHLFLMANNTLMWPNTNSALKPFRAYFTVNVDAGQSAGMPVRRGMTAHIGEPAQMPTGVDSVQDSDIRSQKVIINGTLYIIRGDKMYDAQGQIVK